MAGSRGVHQAIRHSEATILRCAQEKNLSYESLLDLLQIADSSFPSGSYAHSLGLETLYASGEVALDEHLHFLLKNGLARVELPVIRLAFHGDDPEELDALVDVLLPVREFRMASRSIGRSFLRAASRIRACRVVAEHHAVV